jgi:hypothetical protein
MDTKYIKNIQNRIVKLLITLSNNLQESSKNQCSEVSRLVALWILKDCPNCKADIFKGTFQNNLSHDVLSVASNKKIFLIDPTIWQFFPKAKSILIGIIGDSNEIVKILENKYKGSWRFSETIDKYDKKQGKNLLTIIKKSAEL